MILCDTNVWLALSLSGHSHHKKAKTWLADQTESEKIHFCRATQTSFLRLLTSERVMAPFGLEPLSNKQAWDVYAALLRDFRIWQRRDEPQELERFWYSFAARETASPKLWMDAYLAAFAAADNYQLVTFDKAFKQFSDLKLEIL